jgi:hypothetical protein
MEEKGTEGRREGGSFSSALIRSVMLKYRSRNGLDINRMVPVPLMKGSNVPKQMLQELGAQSSRAH